MLCIKKHCIIIPTALEHLFLLVPVLPQTFFAFVGCHLVPFSLFSTWHNLILSELFHINFILHLINKGFCRLESWDIVGRNNDSGIF